MEQCGRAVLADTVFLNGSTAVIKTPNLAVVTNIHLFPSNVAKTMSKYFFFMFVLGFLHVFPPIPYFLVPLQPATDYYKIKACEWHGMKLIVVVYKLSITR